MSKQCVVNAASVLDKMRPEVDPCKDFYEYSCGGIRDQPPDSPKWSRFVSIARRNQRLMKKVSFS